MTYRVKIGDHRMPVISTIMFTSYIYESLSYKKSAFVD